MKKVDFYFLIAMLIISLFPVAGAETTFFEGDNHDSFIMYKAPEVVATEEVLQLEGGTFFIGEEYDKIGVCSRCLDSLREKIKLEQSIEYTEEEVIVLANEINEDLGTTLSNNQVRFILENFEDECGFLPLLGGLAGGRVRDLLGPLLFFVVILILGFIITLRILFIIVRNSLKKVFSRRRKKRVNKKRKR